jgi:hypothetical protein
MLLDTLITEGFIFQASQRGSGTIAIRDAHQLKARPLGSQGKLHHQITLLAFSH